MEQIRSRIKNVPDTYQKLIKLFLSLAPNNYARVHSVADTYRDIIEAAIVCSLKKDVLKNS